MIDWHLPNRPIKNCFLHRLPRLQIVCKLFARHHVVYISTNTRKIQDLFFIHLFFSCGEMFVFVFWNERGFFLVFWTGTLVAHFSYYNSLDFILMHHPWRKNLTLRLSRPINFLQGKIHHANRGVNCRWSFMSFRWFFSLSRRWKLIIESGVMFFVSKLKSSNFSNKTNISYVTSIFLLASGNFCSVYFEALKRLKDVHANCFCASLLRT